MIEKVRMTITAPQNIANPRPKYSFLSFKNIVLYHFFSYYFTSKIYFNAK